MRARFVATAVTLALMALHAPVGAIVRPDLLVGFGGSFAVTGAPSGGGLSSSLSALWPVGERAGFGVRLFADDSGTREGRLVDPNNGADLGSVGLSHRWVYGASWRGDLKLFERGRWDAGLLGDWGYWRIEDDVRGRFTGASSAAGFVLGGKLARQIGTTNSAGLALRYHRMFTNRESAPNLVGRYATVAFEWCWLGADRR
ncbi:MAG: hypothetical protein ABIU54_14955 [Candidatus Eisenbacteria bacterium]